MTLLSSLYLYNLYFFLRIIYIIYIAALCVIFINVILFNSCILNVLINKSNIGLYGLLTFYIHAKYQGN